MHKTNGFMKFVYQMADVDDMQRFWVDFVLSSIVIWDSESKLCISSLKQLEPLFATFDCDTYERIIPLIPKTYEINILKHLNTSWRNSRNSIKNKIL